MLHRHGERTQHCQILPRSQPQSQIGAAEIGRGELEQLGHRPPRNEYIVAVQRGGRQPGPAGVLLGIPAEFGDYRTQPP